MKKLWNKIKCLLGRHSWKPLTLCLWIYNSAHVGKELEGWHSVSFSLGGMKRCERCERVVSSRGGVIRVQGEIPSKDTKIDNISLKIS